MKHVVDRTSTAARDRFAQSALVASLWPQPIRDASLPYFAVQDAINVYMFGDRPGMAALHQALTRSPVTTPALWLLGSNWDVQRHVTEASHAELAQASVQFQLGVRLIAERSHGAAGRGLRPRGDTRRTTRRCLRPSDLCPVHGRSTRGRTAPGQRALGDGGGSPPARPNAFHTPFWNWMRDTFGIVTS